MRRALGDNILGTAVADFSVNSDSNLYFCRVADGHACEEPKDGTFLDGVADSMLFKDGICGVASNGILCTSDDDENWSCKNQGGKGNVIAKCSRVSRAGNQSCKDHSDEVIIIKNLVCTGDINCDA